jgi:hypothetical protein
MSELRVPEHAVVMDVANGETEPLIGADRHPRWIDFDPAGERPWPGLPHAGGDVRGCGLVGVNPHACRGLRFAYTPHRKRS